MKDDIRFMRAALAEAHAAGAAGEVPVGALLVVNNEIMAISRNRIIADSDPTAHAELLALREAAKRKQYCRLDGAILYTTLEPCSMCAGAIVLARVKRVVIGAMDLKTGAGGSVYNILQDNRLNHICEVERGVLARESSELMRQFFDELRNARGK